MNIEIDFFKSIYNDDIIFHYTKASTAIDYILFNQQLRFSKARSSADPIESKRANRRPFYVDSEVDAKKSPQHYQDIQELRNFLSNLEEQFSQICFCQNNAGSEFASDFYHASFHGHEELFGFTKLRMWDQYADKFSGVCIAFSKEKIIYKNKEKFDLIEGKVKYLNFRELYNKKIGDIRGNHLMRVGKEVYKEELTTLIWESFFCKHIDYSGENEYRIGTLFYNNKCSPEIIRDEVILDQNMMLDIEGCVRAIFFSSFINDKQKDELLKYAHQLNVNLIEMKWKHDSFEPRDYKKDITLMNSFH